MEGDPSRAYHMVGRPAAFGSSGRLGDRAGALLRKTGLAVAVHEMLKRRSVAERLHRDLVASGEMRVADEKQVDLCPCFVEATQLGKACRQKTA